MHRESTDLRERRVRKRTEPAKFVQYPSQREAYKFLEYILTDDRGVGLVHGPESSGKSDLVRQFIREQQSGRSVAIVDGTGLRPSQFMSEMLAQFGYEVVLSSADELFSMVKMLLVQQTRANQAPVLVLEKIDKMFPDTLCALCELASITVQKQFAMRIVIIGDQYFRRVINSPSMMPIADRLIGHYELKPLTAQETLVYMYAQLEYYGVSRSNDALTMEVSEKLSTVSGGWAGKLNDIATLIADKLDNSSDELETSGGTTVPAGQIDGDSELNPSFPENEEVPKLLITHNGETLYEEMLAESRALIGRSSECDIVIDSQFVSKQHALIMRVNDVVVLVDLKSKNGTLVNSRRVERKLLRNNDIISLGEHRIKLIYANNPATPEVENLGIADTAKMKTLADARLARKPVVLPSNVDKKKA
jgi:type II secretory pathway predicted ATPase ExeA